MQFNWQLFKNTTNKIAIICNTMEEAIDLSYHLDAQGLRWASGRRYTEYLPKLVNDVDIGFSNTGHYLSSAFYKRNGYQLIQWSDFMRTTFTKADLKNFMLVELRNGQLMTVYADKGLLLANTRYGRLSSYSSDLQYICKPHNAVSPDKELDIVAVYDVPKEYSAFLNNDTLHRDLLWRQHEVTEMTLAEVCEALGKRIKIVE